MCAATDACPQEGKEHWVTLGLPASLCRAIVELEGSAEPALLGALQAHLRRGLAAHGVAATARVGPERDVCFIVPATPRAVLAAGRTRPHEQPASLFSYFHYMGHLKKVKRTGWLLEGILPCDAESVAEHMYRMAMLALSIAPRAVSDTNIDRCVKMCLVHDCAEAITGDIPPSASVSKGRKYELEHDAVRRYVACLGEAVELAALWHEYEQQTSPEAILVKDLDRFEFLLQAYEYEIDFPGLRFDAFFDNTRGHFKTALVKGWMGLLDDYRSRVHAQ